MGIVDKISPKLALRRERLLLEKDQVASQRALEAAKLNMLNSFHNSGYSHSGGSRRKNSMKGWNAESLDPFSDIDLNLHTLRTRSRDLWMGAPLATSAIKGMRTNIVGAGLKLNPRIDHEFLGISPEEAQNWKVKTQREFELWAESKHCDVKKQNDFYELQQLALIGWLMNGDGFGIKQYGKPTSYMPYELRIRLIEADRVSTPNQDKEMMTVKKLTNGNSIYNGVEVDSSGAVIAYHICNAYPGDMFSKKEWARVKAFGDLTGTQMVLQLMVSERAEQHRGVPLLAPVIEPLKQISRYTEAELMAAVVTAFLTVFIKQEGPKSDDPFGQSIDDEDLLDGEGASYQMGPGTINTLGIGESIEVVDPKRPASGFDGFVSSLAKMIGAALEIPSEVLLKSFTASYSASRGALLEAWKSFRMWRTWFSNDFCQPVYESWLDEAVAKGRVKAPGYFLDPAIRKAWQKAEWNGPAPGQLDPVKEVTAAIQRVEHGFSTREKETIEMNGGDWDRNVKQCEYEVNKLKGMRGEQLNEVLEPNKNEQ